MKTLYEGVLLGKKSACNPNKTSSVLYHNLQGVIHILELNQPMLLLVWVIIALSINIDTEQLVLGKFSSFWLCHARIALWNFNSFVYLFSASYFIFVRSVIFCCKHFLLVVVVRNRFYFLYFLLLNKTLYL